MPDQNRMTESTLPPPTPESGHGLLEQEHSSQERRRALYLVMGAGALGAAAAAAFNLLRYFQTEIWQMLAVAIGSILAIVFLVPAFRLARRNRFESASYWAMAGMVLAFATAELFHIGMTIYLLVGGILLILVVGLLLFSYRWTLWMWLIVAYAAYFLLVNWLEPLPRYDVGQLGMASDIFAVALVVFLVIAAVWGMVRAYRRLIAIRTRLLVAFVAVVLVPAVAISAVSIWQGTQDARNRVIDQLESVATLKEAEIRSWLDGLQNDLFAAVTLENASRHLRTVLEGESPDPDDYAAVRADLQSTIGLTEGFEEMFLMDLNGQVILSTDSSEHSQVGADYGRDEVFLSALAGYLAQTTERDLTAAGESSVIMARPVFNLGSDIIGVLAGRASLDDLSEIMQERAGLGDTGETYLVDEDLILLTDSRYARFPAGETEIRTDGSLTALQAQVSGSGVYPSYRNVPVIGVYHWLPSLRVALLAEQERSEALAATISTLTFNLMVTVVSVLIAIGVGLLVTRAIANPLASLTETASRIAGGDLALKAHVEREDEVGKLAHAFNSMTAQLRGLIGSLEERVARRTRDLERRSAYLEASAKVGRAASSILDTGEIVRQAVNLIGQRFDLYYVGLFELDEDGEWAVLRAGTGEAGRAMLARGHRIHVGEGMVGWSIANAASRIASRAEADAVRLAIPELPETRSEAALPLRSRGQVLGALSVQATDPEAFDEDMLVALQIMADQVAVALDNARLFAASQQALEAERRAYGEISREAWTRLVHGQVAPGYRADEHGVAPTVVSLPQEVRQAVKQGQLTLSGDGEEPAVVVPISVRDQVIGTLRFRKPEGQAWTQDEIALLEGMAAQLGQALEGARLYQDVQRRAVHEQLLAQVSAEVRASLDPDTILKTGIRELARVLEVERAAIEITGPLGRIEEAEA